MPACSLRYDVAEAKEIPDCNLLERFYLSWNPRTGVGPSRGKLYDFGFRRPGLKVQLELVKRPWEH